MKWASVHEFLTISFHILTQSWDIKMKVKYDIVFALCIMFYQQQCFIYSTASFLSKLRAKKVEKLHNSSFYRIFFGLTIKSGKSSDTLYQSGA
jgi:hypothetical protein